MKAIGESPVLQRLMAWRTGTASERALAYVRSCFGDETISPSSLIGSPLDFLRAAEQHDCLASCPGRGDCPTGGMRWTATREELYGRDVFIVRVGPCRARAEAERQAKTEMMVAASRIPEGMKRCTFETFVTKGLDEQVRIAKGLAMACLEDGSSLVLGGGTGVGKTHLGVAMVQALVRAGKCAIFVPTIDLLDEIRAGYETKTADRIQRAARDADALVLDDLAANKTNAWTSERLFALIDDRYRSGRQTIVTTNAMSMKQLEEMLTPEKPNEIGHGGRIVSRLGETSQALFIRARDYRTRKNVQQRLPAA